MNKAAFIATPTLALVLIFAVLMNAMSRGLGETFGVFLLPLSNEFGWSRTTLTGAYVLYMAGYGVCAPLAGQLYARAGPRVTFALGLTALGSGFVIASFAEGPLPLYAGIGLLGALGASAIGMIATSSFIRTWFSHRLTTALGVAHTGLSIGVLIFAPLAQWLIEDFGWRTAYVALGAIALAFVPLIVLTPWSPLKVRATTRHSAENSDANDPNWTLVKAARTAPFWGLALAFFCTSGAYFMVAPQLVAYLVFSGFTATTAAWSFGATGLLAISGMVGIGWAADRFGPIRVVTASYVASALGFIAFERLATEPTWLVLGTALALYGVTAGCRAPIITGLAAKLFPGRGYAAVLGGINAGMGFGAASGALVGAQLIDAFGHYSYLFVSGAALLAVASMLFIIIGPLRRGSWDRRPHA